MKSAQPGCAAWMAVELFVGGTMLAVCFCAAIAGALVLRAYGPRAGAVALATSGAGLGWLHFRRIEPWQERLVIRWFGTVPAPGGVGRFGPFGSWMKTWRRICFWCFIGGGVFLCMVQPA